MEEKIVYIYQFEDSDIDGTWDLSVCMSTKFPKWESLKTDILNSKEWEVNTVVARVHDEEHGLYMWSYEEDLDRAGIIFNKAVFGC